MQLRTYEGPDPLEVWCEYISWMEQSYPKHGPEANLEKLLMSCFQALKDNERYKNDVRFVRLWIKYVSCLRGTSKLLVNACLMSIINVYF